MATIRIPSNKITIKYTSSGEYVLKDTNSIYQGYYYELNGTTYAGKEYKSNNPILVKTRSNSSLLNNIKTATYSLLSNVNIDNQNISSIAFTGEEKVRYFSQQKNIVPILIKEINKSDYQKIQNDPLYQTVEVNFKYNMTDVELDNLDKQMPGIKAYLQSDLIPNTSSDENNPFIRFG